MKKIKKHFLSNADILIFFFSVLFFDYYFRNQLGMSSANAKVIFVNFYCYFIKFLYVSHGAKNEINLWNSFDEYDGITLLLSESSL